MTVSTNFAYGLGDSQINIPKDVQIVADAFKLGKFVQSKKGPSFSGSTSSTELYYFENGAVDTVQAQVFNEHGMGRGVSFKASVGRDEVFDAGSLAPYVLKVALQQDLGAHRGWETDPQSLGHITIHFENGDVWLNYRGKLRTDDDEFIGMRLKKTTVPGRVLRDAADANLGSFIKMDNGVFYFERGNI
jgi:hypothetical protein